MRQRVLLCETVTASSMAELVSRRGKVAGVDLVELRLDGVEDADAAAALDGCPVPAIVTCRPEWEGGRYRGSEETRVALLNHAIDAGADYVDLEWKANRRALRSGASVVLSFHDMAGMPGDLEQIVNAMATAGADVLKVAITASRLEDCVTLRRATHTIGGARVVIAMGAAGLLTRVCPWLFGSSWMYAGSAAPGQLTATELREAFRFGETSSATRIFGVAGTWDAAYALAGAHNREFRAREVDAISVPLAAADARDLDGAVRAFAVSGVTEAGLMERPGGLQARAARDIDHWMAA